ncbi:MAG: outer membrane lipoprotein carrier protein LolA [Paracoccaceae bacterium]|jgi:outer membrane lipoprotein-sorting protein|nr:outer membrane lipoprotein carrier protein LolA [Paracoccaceae bacterium]
MKNLAVFTLSLWMTVLSAGSALAQAASLEAIGAYLNTLKSAQADFVQFNQDGSKQTGTLFLKRPGKARFQYDGENAPLVLISGGQVAVFDPLSNEPPFRFPLSTTPLDTILGRDVDLVNSNLNTNRMDSGEFTVLNVQDPTFAQYGYVSLVFDNEPLKLRQWVVVDAAGTQTAIALSDIENGVRLNGSLFNIRAEMRKRGWAD